MKKDVLSRAVEQGMREADKDLHTKAKAALARARLRNRVVDFACALGSFRAWPDGAVTRLDSDGDSVETVLPSRPEVLVLEISGAVAFGLRQRLRTGFYGESMQDVAERLLCEALRKQNT